MSAQVESLTIGQARELLALFNRESQAQPASPFPSYVSVGKPVFVRTVTGFYTGRVVSASAHGLDLADAAWIADTGRFADFLKSGPTAQTEIEPYPDGVFILHGVIVDVSPWKHDLPRSQK